MSTKIVDKEFINFLVREQMKMQEAAVRHTIVPGATQPGEKALNADTDEIWEWVDAAMIGLDIVMIIAAIATGGLAGIGYVGLRQAIKISLKALVRKGGRKYAKKKFKQLARILKNRANPKKVKDRIRRSLKRSKGATAWKAAKYGVVGSALINWQDTLDIIQIYRDHWSAMVEQQHASKVAGNKARVAVACNTIAEDPKLDYFLKTFFTLYTQHQTFDLGSKQESKESEGLGENYNMDIDPGLWRIDDQMLSALMDDEIINTFNNGLGEIFNRNVVWHKSHIPDKYNRNSFDQSHAQINMGESPRQLHRILTKQYKNVALYMGKKTTKSLAVLKDVVDGGVEADYLLTGDERINIAASAWANMLKAVIKSGDGTKLGIAHPQFFALWCLQYISDGLSRAGINQVVTLSQDKVSEAFQENIFDEAGIEFDVMKTFQPELLESGNPLDRDILDVEEIHKKLRDDHDLRDQEEETGSGKYTDNDYSGVEPGKVYDELPAGLTQMDASGVELTNMRGAMWNQEQDVELETIEFSVENIFSNKKESLRKMMNAMGEQFFNLEIEENWSGKQEIFYEAFQDFAHTILLDPSGRGFGGYEQVKECRKWLTGDAVEGFEKIIGETGMGKQLLGSMLFYYQEVYIMNKPVAAMWTKFVEQKRKLPKTLKIGTWQNTALVISGFVAMAFLDPINKLDKRKIIGILSKAKNLAIKFAEIQAKEPVQRDCGTRPEKEEVKRRAAPGHNIPPPTAVPGQGRGKVKEQVDVIDPGLGGQAEPGKENANRFWEFTDEQNDAVIQGLWSSMAELEKEVNQTISQIFEWSNQVQDRQKMDRKANMQIPGGSAECELYLTRKATRAAIQGLQAELGDSIRELSKNNFGFKLDYKNFNQFICFMDEAENKITSLFDAIKQPDISPLTGDHTLEEKQNNYLKSYILENKHLLVEDPEKIQSLGDFYTHLKDNRGWPAIDAWMVCKILDFIGYKNVSSPQSAKREWFSWETEVKGLDEGLSFDNKAILSEMKTNYKKIRRKILQPKGSSLNYKFWKDNVDHLHGSVLKGSGGKMYHLTEKDQVGTSRYHIVGMSRAYGFDDLYFQSNLVGTFVKDIDAGAFAQERRVKLGVNPLRLEENYMDKKQHEPHKLSGGRLTGLNMNIQHSNKGADYWNSIDLTGPDLRVGHDHADAKTNILTATQSYVESYAKQGFVDLSASAIRDKLLSIRENLNKWTPPNNPIDKADNKRLDSIINICHSAAPAFEKWERAIKDTSKLAKVGLGDSLPAAAGKDYVTYFEDFLSKYYHKKIKVIGPKVPLEKLSLKWYNQEKQKIIEEQDRIDTYLLNIEKLIRIDKKIAEMN